MPVRPDNKRKRKAIIVKLQREVKTESLRDSYFRKAREKGLPVEDLGQVLVDLGIKREEARLIFYKLHREDGHTPKEAKNMSTLALMNLYDTHRHRK